MPGIVRNVISFRYIDRNRENEMDKKNSLASIESSELSRMEEHGRGRVALQCYYITCAGAYTTAFQALTIQFQPPKQIVLFYPIYIDIHIGCSQSSQY